MGRIKGYLNGSVTLRRCGVDQHSLSEVGCENIVLNIVLRGFKG